MRRRWHGSRAFLAIVLAAGTTAAALTVGPAGAATPTVTVTPNADLGDRGFVTVTARNLPAGAPVRATECGVGPTDAACQDGTNGTTDSSGRVDLSVPFRRTLVQLITVNENGAVLGHADCGQTGTRCSIRLSLNVTPFTQLVDAPITFDPTAPVSPPPTLVVTPSTNLAARPIVGVKGSGFFPNHVVNLSECRAAITVFGTELCGAGSTTVADATGHISTIAIVSRQTGAGLSVSDCAVLASACTFRATTDASTFYAPAAGEVARVPLGFDPTAPAPPGPPVTVTPRTALTDQQMVTVAGSGFPANDRVAVLPCATTTTFTPVECDTEAPVTFLADDRGAFSRQFAVQQFFRNGHRTAVDCGVSTPTCMLAVVDYQDSSLARLVPITFATHGPVPAVGFRSRSITEPTGSDHRTKIDLVLSEPTDHRVRVDWDTDFFVGTARQGGDYLPDHRTTVIPAGQTVVTVFIDVVGDRTDEPDEWFPMRITSALGATAGPDARVTIRDDDPPAAVRVGSTTVRETGVPQYAQVPVTLNVPSGYPVSVHFATHQYTARSSRDFRDATGTLVIPAGETRGAIAVVVLGDIARESTETLLVTIDGASHATIADGDAVLTIHDDD